MTFRISIFAISLLALILAGCSSVQNTANAAEVNILRQYIQAFADKNEAAYSSLICPSWESDAYLEFDAYQGMESKLGDLTCQQISGDAGKADVNCKGKISLSYGSEHREIDFTPRIYHLISNGGSWQVCGYALAQ
jgi:hypothetical protein